MGSFYRVRVLVDCCREDFTVLANNANAAMEVLSKLEAEDTGEPLGSYGLHVAMVHRITFGETGPVFEDVTHLIDAKWARATWHECLAYFDNATF